MSRLPLASRTRTAALAATLMLAAIGCASAPAGSLAERQSRLERELAMQCYRHNEGARLAGGSLEVMIACRHWARKQVGVSFSGAAPIAME